LRCAHVFPLDGRHRGTRQLLPPCDACVDVRWRRLFGPSVLWWAGTRAERQGGEEQVRSGEPSFLDSRWWWLRRAVVVTPMLCSELFHPLLALLSPEDHGGPRDSSSFFLSTNNNLHVVPSVSRHASCTYYSLAQGISCRTEHLLFFLLTLQYLTPMRRANCQVGPASQRAYSQLEAVPSCTALHCTEEITHPPAPAQ
jgi:hypothetical protein